MEAISLIISPFSVYMEALHKNQPLEFSLNVIFNSLLRVIKKKYVPLKIWLSRNAINSDRPTSAENPQTNLGCVCVCVCVCVGGGGGGGGGGGQEKYL